MTAAPRLTTDEPRPRKAGEVLLGEDWVSPDASAEEMRDARHHRGLVSLNRSPLARKIVVFNLMALVILIAGVLFLNPFRGSLEAQREVNMLREVSLIASVVEARMTHVPEGGDLAAAMQQTLSAAPLGAGVTAFGYGADGRLLTSAQTDARPPEISRTFLGNLLSGVWRTVASIISLGRSDAAPAEPTRVADTILPKALNGNTSYATVIDSNGSVLFSVTTPVRVSGQIAGAIVLTASSVGIDGLVSQEREQILQMFVVALFVAVGMSLVLASTISNPLSDLAAAAEIGRDRDRSRVAPGRVRIPDLAARPDEIGRLSVAMRGMVAALYDRIDANEQFAADVSHEIKNPLASLRSAVGSLRMVKKEEHRERLLDVIEHDVRRLDRLVSDISNASRLDSELVKEEEEEFNLIRTLTNLSNYLGEQAADKGVDFITDLPPEQIRIRGLEARLAQVFVNLITNAISFCDDGDAVRVWARRRDNRVLVVVEDTGPGIPDQALTKVFKRFYSERPSGDFGNHSGLGLAISKQIIEAHGGVIWAENIRAAGADLDSPPLGARFVVGLPL